MFQNVRGVVPFGDFGCKSTENKTQPGCNHAFVAIFATRLRVWGMVRKLFCAIQQAGEAKTHAQLVKYVLIPLIADAVRDSVLV